MQIRSINIIKIGIVVALNLCLIGFSVANSKTETTVNQDNESTAVVSQYGSKGSEVTKIQQRLKSWGYFDGPVTGNYGTLTTEAVKKFSQREWILFLLNQSVIPENLLMDT